MFTTIYVAVRCGHMCERCGLVRTDDAVHTAVRDPHVRIRSNSQEARSLGISGCVQTLTSSFILSDSHQHHLCDHAQSAERGAAR